MEEYYHAIIYLNIMANIETSFIPEQGVTYQGGSPRSTIATVFSVVVTVLALWGQLVHGGSTEKKR